MTDINNNEEIIDSRDIIESITELHDSIADDCGKDAGDFAGIDGLIGYAESNYADECANDISELKILLNVQDQASDYAEDWEDGATLIRESYFEEYMDETVEDCYEVPKELPSFMTIVLDYVALRMDYTAVDFDGVTYLIR